MEKIDSPLGVSIGAAQREVAPQKKCKQKECWEGMQAWRVWAGWGVLAKLCA